MLEITIPKQHYRLFDEISEEFINIDVEETKLILEHSLVSLRTWEQKWKKPFLGKDELTYEEVTDYIKCMTLNDGVDPIIYKYIPTDIFNKIIDYIKDSKTATWFRKNALKGAQRSSREVITAEIIYYWMIALNIPVEFERWHLSTLLTLIKVVNIKNGGDKGTKMSKKEAAMERKRLNQQRRAAYHSKG